MTRLSWWSLPSLLVLQSVLGHSLNSNSKDYTDNNHSASSSVIASTINNNHNHVNNFAHDNFVSFPLIPHHAEWERRRRQQRHHRDLSLTKGDGSIFTPRRREEAQQVGALYQGYGTHYVDLWCGSPPQRQTVIVDTGSGVTAFPCSGCRDCGVPSYHIDALFVEDDSSTFHPNTCTAKSDCVVDRSRCTNDKSCVITMSYAEGSRWTAYEGVDRCYVAGPHEIPLVTSPQGGSTTVGVDDLNPNHAADLAFDLTFGCQTILTGLFKTQLADGIMGMSNADSTFWAQMFHAQKMGTSRAFALCFSRQPLAEREGTEAGAMTLGGVDTRLHLTPMVYTPAAMGGTRSGFFNVRVRRLLLREGRAGESAQSTLINPNEGIRVLDLSESVLNTGGVIVDSGTTDTYWNRGIASEFNRVFASMSGRQHSNSGIELTDEELHALPTIIFQLVSDLENTNPQVEDAFHTPGMAGVLDPNHPSDILLAFPPTHYMEYDDSTGMYTSRFYPTEGRGSVLGANAMMGHDIFFDVDNDRLGWAESLCDYTTLVKTNGYEFDITGDLKGPQTEDDNGVPSLSTECESYSNGAKCQTAEGCSWYWGKCTKNNEEDPPEANPAQGLPTTAPAKNNDDPNKTPTAEGPGPDRPPLEEDDDEISKFLDACNTPACRYPVLFGLVIALFTGCCLSCCFFKLYYGRGSSRGDNSPRYKYTRAQAEAIEIEMTNGDAATGRISNGKNNGSFRDDPVGDNGGEQQLAINATSSNGSYVDEPEEKGTGSETQFRDEPEFEGDFA